MSFFQKPIVLASIVVLALLFKPVILPFMLEQGRSPRDERIGQLPILSTQELSNFYDGKKVLVVGGTRGVGLGTSLAMAKAGADVTVVGRSETSGERAIEYMKEQGATGKLGFIKGDIGSVPKSMELVKTLEEHVQGDDGGFDVLVVTAAVFPDWNGAQQQEDGIDTCFAIAVVGRYLVFKHMDRFMNKSRPIRALNVLASGEMPAYSFDRDLVSGKRNASSLFESLMTFGNGNELMLKLLDADLPSRVTRVSTHPGMLATDLHKGQAFWFYIVEYIAVSLMGISIEDCGMQQASILASPKLLQGEISYVTSDMHGRLADPKLDDLAKTELPWLADLLKQLQDKST